ncbi:hypothetical protein EDB80DRAFT_781401 [Ilyonectria destructans]|nr:hypothetical protein EDB80DRAFT_781401 [Ilyonectria destructans]
MRLIITLSYVGVAYASVAQFVGRVSPGIVFGGLEERQVHICNPVPPPYTCERSCGPGYANCFGLCYNAGAGAVCCSDGSSCPSGTRCTDTACCPDDVSLEECGAHYTLTIVPPDATTGLPEPTTVEKTISEETTFVETTTSVEITTSEEPATSEEPTSEAATSVPEPTVDTSTTDLSVPTTSELVSTPTTPTNSSATTSIVVVPTNSAGRNAGYDLMLVFGCFGAALVVF